MGESILKIVIIATVEKTPEEFLKTHSNILIDDVTVTLHGTKNNDLSLEVEDFYVSNIESIE
ncbi:hypothetical protein [Bacillus sp. FJAT-22090]|uniref:hypothetical protein n=1 Tax=Bacillus sp. FJAT-22090 TaxID=1581038 RepID=UPI0011A34841|nr:hypothetical protein [Bacillus sp. FJAT-22090]